MTRILRNTLLLFSIFTLVRCGNGQDFHGHIEYELKTQKIDSSFTNDEFLKSFGDKSIFYYDNGNYFQTHTNSMIEFGYLDTKLKQQGLKFKGNDTLYLYDATKVVDEKLVKIETSSLTQEILGYNCERIDFYIQNLVYGFNQSIIFYYSDMIKIDGRRFKGIKLQFADEIYGKLNSIPLSFEILNPMYSVKYTATKILKNDTVSVSGMIKNNTRGLIIKRMN